MGVGRKALHFTCSNAPLVVVLYFGTWLAVSCHCFLQPGMHFFHLSQCDRLTLSILPRCSLQ